MWIFESILPLLRSCNSKLQAEGYHLGLTGSVLFYGQSEKDLDLILYLRQNPVNHNTALTIIQDEFKLKTLYALEGDGYQGKLIYIGRTEELKRVDIFIPHLTPNQAKRKFISARYEIDERLNL